MKFEDYERPAVAVDLVLFRMKSGKNGKKLQIALIKRENQEIEKSFPLRKLCFRHRVFPSTEREHTPLQATAYRALRFRAFSMRLYYS